MRPRQCCTAERQLSIDVGPDMTSAQNSITELNAAIVRTRRIAANTFDPNDLRVLHRHLVELELERERMEQESSR